MGTTNQSSKTTQMRKAGAHRDGPAGNGAQPPVVGLWPEPAPKWGLWATAAMWLAWVAFLIWMMFLRIAHG